MEAKQAINLADALRKALLAMQRATSEAEDTSLMEAEVHILAAIQYATSVSEESPAVVMERIAKALESLAEDLGRISGGGLFVVVQQ